MLASVCLFIMPSGTKRYWWVWCLSNLLFTYPYFGQKGLTIYGKFSYSYHYYDYKWCDMFPISVTVRARVTAPCVLLATTAWRIVPHMATRCAPQGTTAPAVPAMPRSGRARRGPTTLSMEATRIQTVCPVLLDSTVKVSHQSTNSCSFISLFNCNYSAYKPNDLFYHF